MTKPYDLGYQQGNDAANGRPVKADDGSIVKVDDPDIMCPYPLDSHDALLWLNGYRDAWEDQEQ